MTGGERSRRISDAAGVDAVIRVRAGIVHIASQSDAARWIFDTGHRGFRHPSECWGPAADVAPATAGLDSSLRWNDGG
jgi:hypothetical protein